MFLLLVNGRYFSVGIAWIFLLMSQELLAQTSGNYSRSAELQAQDEESQLNRTDYFQYVTLRNKSSLRIYTSVGHLVNLTLVSWITLIGSCQTGYLRLSDENGAEQFNFRNICYEDVNRTFISTFNSIHIEYAASSYYSLYFKLIYRSIRAPQGDACSGAPLIVKASNSPKYISSKNYPFSYPRNLDCAWRIVTEDKNVILKVHVDKGRLTDCHYYTHDYIKIIDGPTEYDDELTTLCGRFLDYERFSSSYAIYVQFHSGRKQTGTKGFRLVYQAIDIEKHFHKQLSATDEIQEVRYPTYTSLYPNNANVSWRILSDGNNAIVVSIRYHRIESSRSCIHDYVDIYDGPSHFSHHITRLCGNQFMPLNFTSTGPAIFIWFLSDGSVRSRGLKFQYSIKKHTITACPQWSVDVDIEQNDKEIIQSSGFPDDYPINAYCRWMVVTDHDNTVMVTIEEMELKPDNHCSSDFLEFYDGSSDSDFMLRRYCSSSSFPTDTFQSSSNIMYILFKSGHKSFGGKGFKLVVQPSRDDSNGNNYNPPATTFSNAGKLAAGIGSAIFIIILIVFVLRICSRFRKGHILRARRHIASSLSAIRLPSSNVIQTGRQQAGVYVQDSSSPPAYEGSTPTSSGNNDSPPRPQAGVYFHASSPPPAYEGSTPTSSGNSDCPPSYTEAISENQHLMPPPEYTAIISDNSFENQMYIPGERAEGGISPPQSQGILI